MKTDLQTKALIGVHYAMRIIMVVAFLQFLFMRHWVDAVSTLLIFLLMITPAVLKEKYNIYLPFGIEFTIVAFIFVSIFLGSLKDFYEKYAWWDGTLHFFSGILTGVVGFLLVYILNERKSKRINLSPFFVSLFSVSFSVALGVIWEIYEYIGDTFFGYHMQENGLPDTMSDLIICMVGALIVGTAAFIWMGHRAKVPFTPKKLA